MFNIIGIDPGTNSAGICIMGIENNEIKELDTIPLISKHLDIYNKRNGLLYHKLFFYKTEFRKILEKYNPYAVAMETPFVGTNKSAIIPLAKINAVFELTTIEYDRDMIFHKVSPIEAKKYMHVKDSSKEAMEFAIKTHPILWKLLPKRYRTQDELDSISIAYHLYSMITLHPYIFIK